MRRILMMLSLCMVCYIECISQNVGRIEGEFNIGVTSPIFNFHGGRKMVGPEIGLAIRRNLQNKPWDFGVQLNISTSVYQFDNNPKSDWTWEQSNRTINILAVCNCNFKQGARVNPFVGAGIGLALCESVNEEVYPVDYASVAVRLQGGIELLRHLRINVFTTMVRKGTSNFGVSIGAVIGGRPVKNNYSMMTFNKGY